MQCSVRQGDGVRSPVRGRTAALRGLIMSVPVNPKIYHIVHMDRLASIVADGALWSDTRMAGRSGLGTTIGMSSIKQRRLSNGLSSHPGLQVGQCVPFYFGPRSVMLYVIHMRNRPELTYRGGQDPILHLEADLRRTVSWADGNERRWAFTSSNAGSSYFDDYADLGDLDRIDWAAVQARQWVNVKENKQAEFLVEESVPWTLFSRIGAQSRAIQRLILELLEASTHRPTVEIKKDWYY